MIVHQLSLHKMKLKSKKQLVIVKRKSLNLILEEVIFTQDFNLINLNKFYQIFPMKIQINYYWKSLRSQNSFLWMKTTNNHKWIKTMTTFNLKIRISKWILFNQNCNKNHLWQAIKMNKSNKFNQNSHQFKILIVFNWFKNMIIDHLKIKIKKIFKKLFKYKVLLKIMDLKII